MGPTWDLSAPDGPHVGPMNLAIRDSYDSQAGHDIKQVAWALYYHIPLTLS